MKVYQQPIAVIIPVAEEDVLCLTGSVPTKPAQNETPGVSFGDAIFGK